MKKIAYLAPVLPALSATFVYNEIFSLEEQGMEIIPFSVHKPSSFFADQRVIELLRKTHTLYNRSVPALILYGLRCFLRAPISFGRVLGMAVMDVCRLRPWTRTGRGQVYRFLAACYFASLLKQSRCEHIHVHFAHVPTDIAMYASALTNIPFSFTAHANDIFERGYLIPEKVKRSKFVATISIFNRRHMASIGADESKIHIVRCGVDTNLFPAPRHQVSGSSVQIGSLGRMVEKKGFDVLLRASALLIGRIDFRLVLAGSGPQEDELKDLASSLNLTDHVEFLGPIPHHEVYDWLKQLDIFVLPCQKDSNGDMDGIPVVLMEAMLCGVPVISTKISGIPELIENGKEGALVNEKSPEQLVEAIMDMAMNKSLGCDFRKNALKKIANEFDLYLNTKRLKKFFFNL